MKEQCKKYRDIAKIAVFSHLGSSVVAVIFSGLVSTLINYYYQTMADELNVDIFFADPKLYGMTLAVSLVSMLVNLPLSLCATRFYLIISRKSIYTRATMREFFMPFSHPRFLLKGSFLVLMTTILNFLGFFVFFFPVYFAFCMSVFVLQDDPGMSPFKALSASCRIMKGHKWLAFRTTLPILLLEMLLTPLLGSIIFSIIIYVIQAVFYVTLAVIYNSVRGENEPNTSDDNEPLP